MAHLRTQVELQKLLEEFEKLQVIADNDEMSAECHRFMQELNYPRNERPDVKLILDDMKVTLTRILQICPYEEPSNIAVEDDGVVIDR